MRDWIAHKLDKRRARARARRLFHDHALDVAKDFIRRERPAITETDLDEAQVWVTGARELIARLAAFTHDEDEDRPRPISLNDEVELIQRARALADNDPDGWPTPARWGRR